MQGLARTAVNKKFVLETVVDCQAANIHQKVILAGELAVGELRAEDKLAEPIERFTTSETKKEGATATILNLLNRELDDGQNKLLLY